MDGAEHDVLFKEVGDDDELDTVNIQPDEPMKAIF